VPSAYAKYCEQCDSSALFVGTHSKPARWWMEKGDKKGRKREDEKEKVFISFSSFIELEHM
jgi:hypothetical protein